MEKIVVIEDDRLVRASVVDTLKAEGYEVRDAPDGLIGLELIKNWPPDLVICDITMPNMDGYAVLTRLRADPATRDLKFIFSSAKGEKTDLEKGKALGANGYLIKPFTRTELLDTLKSVF